MLSHRHLGNASLHQAGLRLHVLAASCQALITRLQSGICASSATPRERLLRKTEERIKAGLPDIIHGLLAESQKFGGDPAWNIWCIEAAGALRCVRAGLINVKSLCFSERMIAVQQSLREIVAVTERWLLWIQLFSEGAADE